jgi:hypothetical protein
VELNEILKESKESEVEIPPPLFSSSVVVINKKAIFVGGQTSIKPGKYLQGALILTVHNGTALFE